VSLALFKATCKSNWIIFIIFFAVLLMYMASILGMYDPENIETMQQLIDTMPQGMMDAFGYSGSPTNLITFIALYYYGFIALMFPMIYCIILANRLVAAHVDRGSMAYLLATPNSRVKIVATQAFYMIFSVTLLLGINTAAGIGLSEIMFPGDLDPANFIRLNLVTILMTLAISSICFFFSCLFNEAKYSLSFGAGIPLLFFLINMLGNVGNRFEWLRFLTIYSLFEPNKIVTGGESIIFNNLVFATIAFVLYTLGIVIFSRRNLYL
jgi:ABC-2 type transport system permease protein